MEPGIGAGLGALGFWLFLAATVLGGIWDNGRKREAQHETLRRLVESGNEYDEKLINSLLGTSQRVDVDLRIAGYIMMFIAPGLAVLGFAIGKPEAEGPLLGSAFLVAMISAGLMVAARYVQRETEALK